MQDINYGFVDRAVHRLAFGGSGAQTMLCDLEMRLHGARIKAQPVDRPIFVTSLARAGTTLILEVLSRHPDVVTHSYRDMPFVLSPLIWRKFMGRFRVRAEAQERAHSDGMLISADSAEAFEEVLWLRECPTHYHKNGIALWGETERGFRAALADHIRRLIASRDKAPESASRYLSKNNANIARLPALRAAFPDAFFVVPLRDPFDHAMSLHGQHMRFLDMHAESGFARDYMRDIGHFEFGASHRPMLFDGMEEVIAQHDPVTLDYWLAYWICVHGHVAQQEDLRIVDMERFTGEKPVAALLEVLGLSPDPATLSQAEAQIRPIKQYTPEEGQSGALLDEARGIYEDLRGRAHRFG